MRFAFLVGVVTCAALILAACSSSSETQRVTGGDPTRGRGAMLGYGCETCHTIPGITTTHATVGPPLDHFAQRRFIAGELENEPDNLVNWIMNPQAIEPGNAMPNLNVRDEAARDIAAYLYTLQ
jgi:cytochrome c